MWRIDTCRFQGHVFSKVNISKRLARFVNDSWVSCLLYCICRPVYCDSLQPAVASILEGGGWRDRCPIFGVEETLTSMSPKVSACCVHFAHMMWCYNCLLIQVWGYYRIKQSDPGYASALELELPKLCDGLTLAARIAYATIIPNLN